jgi:hypothetical protein
MARLHFTSLHKKWLSTESSPPDPPSARSTCQWAHMRERVPSHPVLRSKLDAHRMYVQDQVVIHTTRKWTHKTGKLCYTIIVFTEKTIDSLVEQQRKTSTPQAINRGQRTPLEEIFIIVVYLISNFWAAILQGWVDLWLLLSKWRGKHNNICRL